MSALSDGLKRRGVSIRHACGSIACAATLAAGLVTILLSLSEGALPVIACTVIAFSLGNVIFVLGPDGKRGAALGIVNAITTLAGPLAPSVTRMILDVGSGAADGSAMPWCLPGPSLSSGRSRDLP